MRAAARIAVVVGALGSVVLMLYAGRRNPSAFLLVLFAIWDLSPFVGLAMANRASRRWPRRLDTMVNVIALVVAAGSLAIYISVVLIAPIPRFARLFLIVPLVSWLLLLIPVGLSFRSAGQSNVPNDAARR